MSSRLVRPVLLPLVLSLIVAASLAFSPQTHRAAACPKGYRPAAQSEPMVGSSALQRAAQQVVDRARAARLAGICVTEKHPESYREFAAGRGQLNAMTNAPYASAPAGALANELMQRSALLGARTSVRNAGGAWEPYGQGPLITNDPRFGNVNGEGLVNLNGRVDSLDYDPVGKRLFASLGSGGVWVSDDHAASWRSIGDSLPTQIIGAVTWLGGSGGTVVALSGEPIMAGYARVGYGAFYSRNLGATWIPSAGIPAGTLGFQLASDPTNPNIVYAATSKGLYRSADAGATFSNVRLPVGACAGKTDNQRCLLANMVNDVLVQGPDGFGHKGGRVLAVVGYRAGNRAYPQDGDVIESEGNGLYASEGGLPGSFSKLAATGFAPQERIGKVELGVAVGPKQNHDFVYAIVQDAVIFNGGFPTIDAPEDAWAGVSNTVLNGVYVSSDFGKTWTQMADTIEIAENPTTGSALVGTGQATLYAPGAQAWYNQFIKVDPSRQTADGSPTRIVFGLEEVWQNDNTTEAADGESSFHVIGRYFANHVCLFVDTGQPTCPTGKPPVAATTTHPDQHEALFLPDGKGGVTLFVGNDGGVFTQHVAESEEMDNTKWGDGANNGFHTLLPYNVAMAKDGTVWFGLQDNGSGKIEPGTQKTFMTFGGDGFYVAVDPDNADYAWSEVTGGNMRVTTDGGQTWKTSKPPQFEVTAGQFSNPFVMDPLEANHLLTAGNDVVETVDGANTCPVAADTPAANQQVVCTWKTVFNLGSRNHPGDFVMATADGDVNNLMSAVDLRGDAAYVGYCGPCALLNRANGDATDVFSSGIATNIGGAAPPARTTTNGWHIAAANGLPERYVNGIAIDPKNDKTVFVALSGYEQREWRPPGSFGDKNPRIGKGHVFASTDAGEHFTDISGNLPDGPALSILVRGDQLIVGTKLGAFISSDLKGSRWSVLGNGLPAVQVMSMQLKPGDSNTLVAATFGRGVYLYKFPKTSVLGGKNTKPATKPATAMPATGTEDGAAALVVLTLAAALATALQRRRRTGGGTSAWGEELVDGLGLAFGLADGRVVGSERTINTHVRFTSQ
jgi:hypothetical protein